MVAGVVVVLGVAAMAGWWFLLRDDAPPEADIDAAGETLDEAATPGTGDASSGEAAAVDGTWTVDKSVGSFADFSGTWAGYRFDEELVGIGGNAAVGRTPDVTGTMTVAQQSAEISEGKADEASFSFTVTMEARTVAVSGRLAGETVEITVEGVSEPLTLKRVK